MLAQLDQEEKRAVSKKGRLRVNRREDGDDEAEGYLESVTRFTCCQGSGEHKT